MKRITLMAFGLAIGASLTPSLAAPAGAAPITPPGVLPLVPVDDCGAALVQTENLPATAIDDTSSATDLVDLDGAGSCAGGGTQTIGTGTGPDHVYGLRVDQACTLQLALRPTGSVDLALYVLTGCGDVAGSCVQVSDALGADGLETVDLAAAADTDYFVVVDGNQGGAGSYELTISETTTTGCRLQSPSECGNDSVEPGEECDDGNRMDGDGCSADCTEEPPPDAGADAPDAGTPGPDAGPLPDAGSMVDGGPGLDAGPGGDAGAPPPEGDGGCCQAGPAGGSLPPLVLVLLVHLWGRRRRRCVTDEG